MFSLTPQQLHVDPGSISHRNHLLYLPHRSPTSQASACLPAQSGVGLLFSGLKCQLCSVQVVGPWASFKLLWASVSTSVKWDHDNPTSGCCDVTVTLQEVLSMVLDTQYTLSSASVDILLGLAKLSPQHSLLQQMASPSPPTPTLHSSSPADCRPPSQPLPNQGPNISAP